MTEIDKLRTNLLNAIDIQKRNRYHAYSASDDYEPIYTLDQKRRIVNQVCDELLSLKGDDYLRAYGSLFGRAFSVVNCGYARVS